jgi:hypothetical protein
MMSIQTSTLYPPGGFGAPKNRRGHAQAFGHVGLPPGTEVFSADNHISLSDDIFYERFPDDSKENAPRIRHNESTFGYSEKSLAAVVGAVGPERAARIASGNIKQFLGLP